jgi:hypothetical protein
LPRSKELSGTVSAAEAAAAIQKNKAVAKIRRRGAFRLSGEVFTT